MKSARGICGISGIRLKTVPGSITVATTRPETMLGDTAVAVNPADERYRSAIGRKLVLPLLEARDSRHRG